MKKKPSAATLKRPASAAGKKRPAGSLAAGFPLKVDMSDIYEFLKSKDARKLTRGSFTSRAHDAAKRRMLMAGESKEDAAAFARMHYGNAAELWAKISK